jgi:hypothetical protein
MGQEGSNNQFEHSTQQAHYSERGVPEQGRMRMLYSADYCSYPFL